MPRSVPRLPVCAGLRLAGTAVSWCAALTITLVPSFASALNLLADQPFVLDDNRVELALRNGRPGARFVMLASSTPAFVSAGDLGTLYLAPGTISALGGGQLDADGEADTVVTLSPPAASGDRRFLQVLVLDGPRTFSNSVAVRVQDSLPSGGRGSRALAVTADGRRAYVVHQVDGTVSVIDATADTLVANLPITTGARSIPHRPVDVAISPDGELAFVLSATADFISVIEVATDSVVAEVPTPRGNRNIAFDFEGAERRVYVTNETANAVLVLRQEAPGTYSRLGDLRLRGRMPGPLVVLTDGRLVVGQRVLGELELIDPQAPQGQQTVARTPLDGIPFDLALSPDGELRVAAFISSPVIGVEGTNEVLRVDPSTLAVLGTQLVDLGTDYKTIAVADGLQAVGATANGVAVISDAAGSVLDLVELAPGEPNATPEDIAVVRDEFGAPQRLYVLDFVRETVRPVLLADGPPYALADPIALGWSGVPRTPLGPETSDAEDGAWLFSSVSLVGGDALAPNPVTCQSCHTDGVADNLLRGRQVPPMWGLFDTAPYGSSGSQSDLSVTIAGALNRHNKSGIPPIPQAQDLFEIWLEVFQPPPSIYLEADGSLGDQALAGRQMFETIGCEQCHRAPFFIPEPPDPRTIEDGIGTGIAPINVPSLRGAWASAPYLHDGRAVTLRAVFANPEDTHGTLTAGLTSEELAQLIAYLKTL
jgi:YVTN family beta-propeller protein